MSYIIVEPYDLWDYYERNKDEFYTTMHEVAGNYDYGIKIYVTRDGNKPQIVVEADDEEICREEIVSKQDFKETGEKIYENYLTPKAIDNIGLGEFIVEDDEYEFIDDIIEEREAELDDAVYQLVDTVSSCYLSNDILDDLKEHFLEYMARKWGIDIYRPMVLEDENGNDFFEEYPYECMIFDDEDNPI